MEILFEKDEMTFGKIEETWERDEVLSQEGLFFLKDVKSRLGLTSQLIKSQVDRLLEAGEDPYKTMGVRKLWGHWVFRMRVFAPYYRNNLMTRYLPVLDHWDGNTLLKQKGLFRLSEVCKKIPFSCVQLRCRAKMPGAYALTGMFKDDVSGHYLVQMEKFAPWIQETWHNDFPPNSSDKKS